MSIFIPVGFAHGFKSLKDNSIMLYACSEDRYPKYESGLIWNDKDLKIKGGRRKPLLSKRDQNAKTFADFFKKK